LFAVVEASVNDEGDVSKYKFVNHSEAGLNVRSWHDTGGSWWKWSELIDPVLIREGLS
jgi:hypothetical protein